jgi:hypothetical protein
MLIWVAKHPAANEGHLGLIPTFVSDEDPRPAREQFDQNYGFAGGWQPFAGFKMLGNGNMKYPDDPPTRLLFEAKLREETIRVYESAWVAIIQPNGEFEVCRMD